jgi:cobalamin-dependent methionine synthase I
MTDLINATFGDLQDEYYPGSTQRRRESREARKNRMAEEREEAKTNEDWDAHPTKPKHLPDGRELEMFHIGALAKALNRRPVTIRSWITKGWIPQARYRTSAVEGSRGDAGRRLFTRAMIEGMQRIAREEGLLDPKPPPITETKFTKRILAEYRSWL